MNAAAALPYTLDGDDAPIVPPRAYNIAPYANHSSVVRKLIAIGECSTCENMAELSRC